MENKPELRILNTGAAPRRGINRREVIERLLGGAGAGLVVPGVATAHPMHKHLMSEATLAEADAKAAAAEWSPEFLDPHQNETLIVLAERIIRFRKRYKPPFIAHVYRPLQKTPFRRAPGEIKMALTFDEWRNH